MRRDGGYIRMDITSFVGKLLEESDVDLLREGARVLTQEVMETEVSGQIGASPTTGAQSAPVSQRLSQEDLGHQGRTIELKIPKVSAGAYFPRLEPRRVVVEASVKGVSTSKVDDLVKALGIDGISRSEASRIRKVLDEEVRVFCSRPIEGEDTFAVGAVCLDEGRVDHRNVGVSLFAELFMAGTTVDNKRLGRKDGSEYR
jgi:putative transposase